MVVVVVVVVEVRWVVVKAAALGLGGKATIPGKICCLLYALLLLLRWLYLSL